MTVPKLLMYIYTSDPVLIELGATASSALSATP